MTPASVRYGAFRVGKKLFVGNLSYNMGDNDLHQLFSAHGNVASAQVIMDRESGRSKGFGFVEMGNEEEAQAAIAALNGTPLDGRNVTVSEARAQAGRGGGGGFGGRRGGGGRGKFGGGGGRPS